MAGIGLNADIYLATDALGVATLQTTTAGNNLASSSTPGATRKTVETTSGVDVVVGGESIDAGVRTTTITAARSTYLDTLVQTENSNLGSATSLDNFLGETETALQEALSSSGTTDTSASDSGLEAATTNFYNAWSTLASDPSSAADQDAVSAAGQAFIQTANSIYSGILGVKSGAFTQAVSDVSQVNSLSTQIASLNQRIENVEANSVNTDGTVNEANDLRDQREADIETLSSLVNITATQDPTNASIINVSLADSSTPTYSATSANALVTPIGASGAGTITVNGTSITLTSGETLADVATSINSAVTGVTATVVDDKLNLSSTSAVTVADGSSGLFATLGLASAATATASSPIYLVNGIFSGGVASGNGTPTYALSVAGSNSDTGVTGYEANQNLTIIATSTANGKTVIANPTGGGIGGLVTFDNSVMGVESSTPTPTTLLGKFDTFIQSVISNVNTATTSGFGTDGINGANFFASTSSVVTPGTPPTTTAGTASTGITNLALNGIYDVSDASYNGDYLPSGSSASTNFDGGTANSIGASLSNSTILPAYSAVVDDIGSQKSASASNLSAQTLVSTQATNQQQSYEGISTDDEMTDLMSFQRAFEASSKFINVIDQMYQTVVNSLVTG